MNLGPAEILVILVVALVVFGPKRLPEVGRQVGGALRELRKVQDTVRTEISTVLKDDDTTISSPRPAIDATDVTDTIDASSEVHSVERDADHDDVMPSVRHPDDPDRGPSGSFS